jgi:SNF2 family DNA or RNA helicase
MDNRVLFNGDNEIILPNDPAVFNLLGVDRQPYASVPHTIETTRLLRNIGFIVPAPIVRKYTWPTNPAPFRTQRVTAALLTMNPRAYVLSEMGTGKTRASLYACDYMFQEGSIKRVLVVAPLSTLSQVWDREIYQYFPHFSVGVVHGTRKKRQTILKQQHHFYVINHDGIQVVLADLLAMKFDVVIIDEVGAFRNKTTDRWKQMNKVVTNAAYAWGMTGSPTPNDPTDAWGMAMLLTPRRAPKYMKEFQRKTMTQITQFKWIAKPDANDHVFEMLQPAVRYKRDDCIELPEVQYKTIDIPASKQVSDTYKKMVAALRTAFKEGRISAANEGVLFMKLLQIASGWVYTDTRGIVRLDNTARVDEVKDIIDQSLGKVIVFASFTHAATELHARLIKKKVDCALIHGGTSKKERDNIFGCFMNSPNPKVLVANPKTMSHGLTLTQANTIVWFTPTTSLETYQQANARITRPGQTQKAMIIHLQSCPIESKIYSRLQQKASLQGALLEMFNDD